MTLVPPRPFELDHDVFCVNLRSARRGAASGPSGMTCEHLQPFLESERDAELLCQVAALLARGHIPPTALQVLRLGRLIALNKPDGGVRGIVVSDVLETSGRPHNCKAVFVGGRRNHSPVPVRVEGHGLAANVCHTSYKR